MKFLTFNEKNLEEELSKLTNESRIAFGLLCCERMFPNYTYFHEETCWGDPNILRNTLDACWDIFVDGRKGTHGDSLKEQCLSVAPDTEDFQTILVSSALDAAVAIATMVELLESGHPKDAQTIALQSLDTVAMYAQEVENMPSDVKEEQVIQSNLMQHELQSQKEDLKLVSHKFDKKKLRDQFRNKRKSNICRS